MTFNLTMVTITAIIIYLYYPEESRFDWLQNIARPQVENMISHISCLSLNSKFKIQYLVKQF